jgi:hypothetical protein
MKRVSTSKILIAAAVASLVALGVFSFIRFFANHTEVRNLSGQTVTDIVMQLRDYQTDWAVPGKLPV